LGDDAHVRIARPALRGYIQGPIGYMFHAKDSNLTQTFTLTAD
jgi:hypothetical protein